MGVKQSTVAALKSAPLSSLIEQLGAPLKRVGREYVTTCLWHDDKRPSLTISDQKGFCFCHVCSRGWDGIDYVQQKKGLEFPEAAELACEILGVRFEVDDENYEEREKRKKEREEAITALQKQQDAFVVNLSDNRADRIRRLLDDRGLAEETIKEFGIGFSPTGFFESRITIPIHDHRGKIVGFTGRATREDQDAKYKNSSDSLLFQKKNLLFNEHRAFDFAVEAGSIIFVEGHLDVISMWQAGIKNVVAAQGTAVPEASTFQRLCRRVKNFVLCFDGDNGGKSAVSNFLKILGPLAHQGTINVSIVVLPQGKDPDDIIKSGGDLYSHIAKAVPWLDWIIDDLSVSLDHNDSKMITEVESRLHELISKIRSKALRTHYIDKASRILSQSDKEAKELARNWGSSNYYVEQKHEWIPRTPIQTRNAVERRLLRTYIHIPSTREQLYPLLEKVQSPPHVWLSKRIIELEDYCAVDLTPFSVMAILAVSESHYVEQLRTLVRPKVLIDVNEHVIEHIRTTLNSTVMAADEDPDESF
jgi:DNA primase